MLVAFHFEVHIGGQIERSPREASFVLHLLAFVDAIYISWKSSKRNLEFFHGLRGRARRRQALRIWECVPDTCTVGADICHY
jgi:hypothetical protein